VERCAECSGRRLAFASARAAVAYEGAVRTLVSAWKERGLRRLAGFAADVVLESVPRPRVQALVAVPCDDGRSLERGHHPAGALAVELGRRWDLPVVSPLARARTVPRQRGLALRERRRNVAGAFRESGRAPPRVCVIDDVYTSGATATAVASALRAAGARTIEVVTFARAVRREGGGA
jgi:predicted amidophosphoribosyltransferase